MSLWVAELQLSISSHDTHLATIALMVHVVDATGQRTRLTDDLKLIPVRAIS